MTIDNQATDFPCCEFTEVEPFFDRKGLQMEQRIVACAELFEVLGWCVAIRLGDDRLWLGGNAAKSLNTKVPGQVPETWSDLIRCFETSCPVRASLDQPGIKIWQDGTDTQAKVQVNLTKREFEVFGLLRDGKTSPEISQILGCSPRTVEKHVENIYRKQGQRDRATAIFRFSNTRKPG